MRVIKILILGFSVTFTSPMQVFADDRPSFSNDEVLAAGLGKTEREKAILIATELARCAGFFQATALVYLDNGDTNISTVTENTGELYYDASKVVWSNYGTDYTNVLELKEKSRKSWASMWVFALDGVDAVARKAINANVHKCQKNSYAVGAISALDQRDTITNWK